MSGKASRVKDGGGLVFSRVKIDNNSIMVLSHGASGKIARLHGLVVVAASAATVTVSYDDDGAGTNAVALTGAMSLAANGVLVIPFDPDPRACLSTAVGKHLTLTPSAAVDGYAIVSVES